MPKRSLVENALHAIKQDIVCGRLANNQPIKVKELSDNYRFGATPIREALNQLAATGLVSAKLNCGFKVPLFSREHMQSLFELRFLLEPVAIKSSLSHPSVDWEEDLVLLRHRAIKSEQIIDKVFARRNLYLHMFANCKSDIMRMAIITAYDCCLRYYYQYQQHHKAKSKSDILNLVDSLIGVAATKRAYILKCALSSEKEKIERALKF